MILKKKLNSYSTFIILLLFSVVFSEAFFINSSLVYLLLIFFFLLINLKLLKFSNLQIISLLLLVVYLSLVIILAENPLSLLNNFKYYFGFIFFILFFKIYSIDKNFIKYFKIILMVSVIFIFFDSVIINFFPQIQIHEEVHTAKFFGFYKRPPGFAGNSSISSAFILFAYLILIKVYDARFKKIEHLFIHLSIFLLFSSTGFILMIITLFLLIYEHEKITSYVTILLSGAILFLLFVITTNIDSDYAQKISFNYFYHIYQEKLFYIKNLYFDQESIKLSHKDLFFMEKFLDIIFERNECSKFFGCQLYVSHSSTSGDIGIMGVFEIIGLFGAICILTILIAFSKFFINNFIYFLLIIFISLHYGFIFSNMGGLLFAIILTNDFKSFNNQKLINE